MVGPLGTGTLLMSVPFHFLPSFLFFVLLCRLPLPLLTLILLQAFTPRCVCVNRLSNLPGVAVICSGLYQ